jgi:hypothetical protein
LQANGGDDLMTLAEFAKGTTTFVLVIVAGLLSETYLDRHLPARETHQQALPSDGAEAKAPSTASTACVENDGTWKNWSWSNVPILAPKCPEDR